MNRRWALLLLFILPFSLHASRCFTPEFKISYFRFSDDKLREIFDDGGPQFQGELNYSLAGDLFFWAQGGYFQATGRSLGGKESTRMRISTATAGLKYMLPIGCACDFYVGSAFRYFFMDIHNDSDFVRQNVSKNGVGGVVTFGANLLLCGCFVLDPFVEYSFRYMDFRCSSEDLSRNIRRHGLKIGGWAAGSGFGYRF